MLGPLFDIYFCPLNALYPILKRSPECRLPDGYPRAIHAGKLHGRGVGTPRLRCTRHLVNESTIACTISDFCKDSFIDKLGADPSLRCKWCGCIPKSGSLMQASEASASSYQAAFIMSIRRTGIAHKNVKNLVTGYLAARKHNGNLPRLVLVGTSH
jgi:hypothetical protein